MMSHHASAHEPGGSLLEDTNMQERTECSQIKLQCLSVLDISVPGVAEKDVPNVEGC